MAAKIREIGISYSENLYFLGLLNKKSDDYPSRTIIATINYFDSKFRCKDT